MTCTACDAAHVRVSHLFHANCQGCAARAIARGRNFRKSMNDGFLDRWYRRELEQMGVTHEDVKREHALDQLERRT
jgi:hypothetical protein